MIFLGIDCGTQSTKTIALDLDSGEVLASARKPYGLVPNLPRGAMEQELEDWMEALDETVLSVVAQLAGRRSEIRGMGVSGQQHGLVTLDEEGAVVRPAKLWCDTSTEPQCERITAHFGGTEAVIQRVGNAMLPGYTAPKILWMVENEPENWARTRSILLPHDYLNFRLSGRKRMEFGDASGTALMDVTTRSWNGEVVDFIAGDLAGKLPELGSSAESAGVLRAELADRWGLPDGVLISAGGGDNMMGAIGTGNVAEGIVSASLGTSGTVYAFAAQPVVDAKGEVAAFCDSTDHWLPLICTMNVTLATELARELLAMDFSAYDEEVLKTSPVADGLVFLPYLSGERTPSLPRGRGVLYGLTTENFTRGHLARAVMEGVTLGLGYGMARFRELGMKPTEIRLTGGGSLSKAWRQICADVFGVPVVCLKTKEGAALGAAIQAAWAMDAGVGLEALTDRLVASDEETRTEPAAGAVAVYNERLACMNELRGALSHAGYL